MPSTGHTEAGLTRLEKEYVEAPTPEGKIAMYQKKAKYQSVEKNEFRTTYLEKPKRIYDEGNKRGKLLAWIGSKKRESMFIRELKMTSGEMVQGNQELEEELAKQLEDFYRSRLCVADQEVLDFIKDCPMSQLDAQQTMDLVADIISREGRYNQERPRALTDSRLSFFIN
ncbi:hypothetical protein NDU88_001703 [Pleurodeles waltl]|uniref:Uncharacterized protein n=1 Tax=Pleurodeles waltl TaxID=8319 RepID=A0AAV7UV33_PLEWA|nr:hypothetical protein NDU88_001703 [Pleurodeles waltl]